MSNVVTVIGLHLYKPPVEGRGHKWEMSVSITGSLQSVSNEL